MSSYSGTWKQKSTLGNTLLEVSNSPPECVDAENGAPAIADDDVQDPVIPPALGEVVELMLEAVLQELEHDGDDGGEPPVPKYQRLAPVAHQVRHDEDVHLVLRRHNY